MILYLIFSNTWLKFFKLSVGDNLVKSNIWSRCWFIFSVFMGGGFLFYFLISLVLSMLLFIWNNALTIRLSLPKSHWFITQISFQFLVMFVMIIYFCGSILSFPCSFHLNFFFEKRCSVAFLLLFFTPSPYFLIFVEQHFPFFANLCIKIPYDNCNWNFLFVGSICDVIIQLIDFLIFPHVGKLVSLGLILKKCETPCIHIFY